IPTDKAWRKAWLSVAHKLYGNYYEELTPYDRHLTEQYDPPSRFSDGITRDHQPASLLPGGITFVTGFQQDNPPPELVDKVDRAYFRLAQHDKIEAWFEDRGFDLKKPISEEEFERHFDTPAPALKITNAMIDDHVLVAPKLGIDSKMAHPTQDACVKAWEAKHGSAARERVRNRYNHHAEKRGITVKRGPRSNFAK